MKCGRLIVVLMCLSAMVGEAETVVRRPGAQHALKNRARVGCPAIAVSKANGRMWVTWLADRNCATRADAFVVLATSIDGGVCWREMLVADSGGADQRRMMNPMLMFGPNGKLWWSWNECDVSGRSMTKELNLMPKMSLTFRLKSLNQEKFCARLEVAS